MYYLLLDHNVSSKEDIVRPLFDFLYDKKDEELMANLGFDNDMLRSLDNGKKTLLICAKELKSQVKRRTLTLCQTCLKEQSYVKAKKRSTMCQPCEIWKIFDSQRKKLLQEQEHRYADEEQKAILRLKKKKEMEEKLKRKQQETSNYVNALR